jgi:Flp pilus assembly secretin CpaC
MAVGDDGWSRKMQYCRRASVAAKLSASAFGLALLAATVSSTWAADRTVILTLGTTSMLLIERPFKILLVGDPNVVDALASGDRSAILRPLSPGKTNIVFLDERNIAITNVGILVCDTGVSLIAYRDGSECEAADE